MSYYTPNAQNVPLIDEKAEVSGKLSLQKGLYSRGLNLQTAFSPVDHIGFMLNYHYLNAKYSYDVSNFWTSLNTDNGEVNRNFFEIGMGYYTKIQEKSVFELYAGIGWGGARFENIGTYYYGTNYVKGRINDNRYFLQPAFGWIFNEHLELGLSNRFCLLYYKNPILNGGNEIEFYDLLNVNDNPLLLIEPAVTFRVGGEKVKFQYQVCFSSYIGNYYGYYDPLSMSFAIFFRINAGKQN